MGRFRLRTDAGAATENQSVTGNILANDSLAVKVTYVTFGGTTVAVPAGGTTLQGTYGTLFLYANGDYLYSATSAKSDALAAGTSASDVFTYSAVDSTGSSKNSTLTLKVTGVNDAPVLVGATTALPQITDNDTDNGGQTVSSFLTSTDVDANALKGIAITGLQSATGKWQYSIDGRVTWVDVGTVTANSALLLRSSDYIRYAPNTETNVTASFTYLAWDQTSGTVGSKVSTSANGDDTSLSANSATASINVVAVNDAPIANPTSASGIEDGGPITGQLTATDPDSTTFSYALVSGSQVGGSVQLNSATGDFVFTPSANFNGTASFQFIANDGQLNSAPATATIAISPVNDAPTATVDSASTPQGTPVLIDVLGNDSDIDGDTLSVSQVGSANNGLVAIEAGQIRYTPNAYFVGADMFTYEVSDGHGGTATAGVSINVTETTSLPPSTVSVTFREGSNGYTGVVDTMLKQASPNTVFGDAIVLRPDNDSGAQVQGLLEFNNLFGTQPGQIPFGATIISAVLTLETTNPSGAGGTINRMLVDWNANSTWNSLGSGVQIDGIEATSSGAITVGKVALGTRTLDVTDSLQAWASAGTSLQQNAANHGWLFKPTSSDGWDFTSAQGTAMPVLTITYAPMGAPPPPTVLPIVSIQTSVSASGLESADGKISFTISLDRTSTQEVTVAYNTVDWTAIAGRDFVGLSGSVQFSPGETVKTMEVVLLDDITPERLEQFVVQLNSATNAKIGVPLANATISDNDVATLAIPALDAHVVAVLNLADGSKYHDGGTGIYGISDPSGLAYIPGLDTLFIADSEHDESPFFSSTNMFGVRPNGDFVQGYKLTSFTREPTGLAYNSSDGYLYISDDDKQGVFWVSPTNPSANLGFFSTARLGFTDTEDLKFDPLTGHLHILDGSLKQIIELTSSGEFIDSIPLPSIMTDAEALAYDSVHDLFFVASGKSPLIWLVDRMGEIRGTIDVLSSYGSTLALKGMELAPSSDPNDGDTMSLYVADYGVDQQNDGQLFEINLGTDWWT